MASCLVCYFWNGVGMMEGIITEALPVPLSQLCV